MWVSGAWIFAGWGVYYVFLDGNIAYCVMSYLFNYIMPYSSGSHL